MTPSTLSPSRIDITRSSDREPVAASPLPIHVLTTGHVRIKRTMKRGVGTGLRRRGKLGFKGPMVDWLPIHAFVIEHPEGPIVVDTGATHLAHDVPFAQFRIDREQELDHALRAAGFAPDDIATVVLTHVHGDHADGLPHLPAARQLVGVREIEVVRSLQARFLRRATHQPLPANYAPEPLALDGPRFGAFAASTPLTADGRVVAVPTPGHTAGHLSVFVVQPDHHVLLAGDASYDQAQLLDVHVDGVSPSDADAKTTMRTILAHAADHPTVFVPSHDPESAARLIQTSLLPAAGAA